ncbi:MAG TPA: protein kinase [Kofleriaceae bacterium]|nr:protein kinase [Kofleriaceae bacterium]
MEDADNDPRLGTLLQGRYQIMERVATGAMGVVYRGERVKLGRKVAIKFLLDTFAAEAQFLQRFEREARAMSRLAHPHCVSVIDFGVDDVPYVVMDFVQGKTLESVLEAGRLPVPRALHIGRQLLAGLAHAHGKDIIHRDIKPANIMLTEATGTGDHIRILDFGLAKLRGGEHDLTMTQVVVGTPSYMSPEQTRGDAVDARSDVYSAGVLLFQLVTGKKPFVADETFELLRQHREQPAPRLSEVAPDLKLSRELENVVSRAMAKDPEERYRSAIELSDALEAVPEALLSQTGESHTLNVRRQRKSRGWGLLLWLIVLGALGGGVAYGWPHIEGLWRTWKGSGNEVAASPERLEIEPQPVNGTVAVAPDEAPKAAAGSRIGDALAAARDAEAAEATDAASAAVGMDAAPVIEAADATPGVAADAAPVTAVVVMDAGTPAPPADAGAQPAAIDTFRDAVAEAEATIRNAGTTAISPAKDDTPREVNSVDDVKALMRAGKREAAIAGLNKLRRQHPKSAYIPYLLGHLYFEKMWWTDGMESYRAAIHLDRSYRRRAPLIRNVIHALGSDRTRRLATRILVSDVGRTAVRYLRYAARHHDSRKVRQRAAALARRISR